MKFVTQSFLGSEKQTKIELLFQVTASAILATVLVTVAVLMTSPYSVSVMQRVAGA